MPEQRERRIVRELLDEPHVERRRVSVLTIRDRVEGRGLDPATVADRHGLDLADVYRALAYYHEHPREMEQLRREREAALEEFRQHVDRPEDVDPDSR